MVSSQTAGSMMAWLTWAGAVDGVLRALTLGFDELVVALAAEEGDGGDVVTAVRMGVSARNSPP